MVEINDNLVYTEDYVDNCGEHTHVIHRSVKERVEDLEEVVVSLCNQLSSTLDLEPVVVSIMDAITIEKKRN